MKLIRSSKCSLKFATSSKISELKIVLTEYGRVCNIFIEHFWKNDTPSKSDLLKDIVNIPQDTWLSARLRKVAAREAIDMITAVRERWKDKPWKISMPVHKGKRAYVSCTIADLQEKETKEFDAWLHLQSKGWSKPVRLTVLVFAPWLLFIPARHAQAVVMSIGGIE